MCVCVCCSPSDSSTLLVVDLDELPEAAGVVVVGRLGVPEGLGTREDKKKGSPRGQRSQRNRQYLPYTTQVETQLLAEDH